MKCNETDGWWRQQGPQKCLILATSLHGIRTWRWRQQSPPKHLYPTISLHDVTTWR